MNESPAIDNDAKESRVWMFWGLLVLLILTVLAIWSSTKFEQYHFNDVTAEGVWRLLFPLFVIAVFLERAQEVFITTWRGIDGADLQARVKVAERHDDREAYHQAVRALHRFKHQTKRYSFIAGVSGGVLISIAGVRVLHPLLNWDIEYTNAQKIVFNVIDIYLTGGLIGGGADGIHKIMSVFLDFMDQTRTRIKVSTEEMENKK